MPHIVIADDDSIQLELRKQLFEGRGHTVATALTPFKALRAIEAKTTALVIIDLRFPNGEGVPDANEGLALIRRLRDDGHTLPVLVLSGWPADIHGLPEEKLVTRILMKPVRSAVLADTVREMIA